MRTLTTTLLTLAAACRIVPDPVPFDLDTPPSTTPDVACDDPVQREPLAWYADADADGFGDPLDVTHSCTAPPGHVADAGDCDDGDPAIHPGAAEAVGDEVDSDCDGFERCWVDGDGDGVGSDAPVDLRSLNCEGAATISGDCDDDDPTRTVDAWFADADGDGRGDPADRVLACEAPTGRVTDAGDCDDADPSLPGAWYVDADADGHGDPEHPLDTCTPPPGVARAGDDCDDGDAAVYPGAAEIPYDTVDQDCDGADLVDVDGDGHAGGPTGDDCDDRSANIHPGAPEICDDGVDQDCNPSTARCGLSGWISTDDADRVLLGSGAEALGVALLGGHDLTGDGVPDLAIGAPQADTSESPGREGAVYLSSGADLLSEDLPAPWRLTVDHPDGVGSALALSSGSYGAMLAIGGHATLGFENARIGSVHRALLPIRGDADVTTGLVFGEISQSIGRSLASGDLTGAGYHDLLALADGYDGDPGSVWWVPAWGAPRGAAPRVPRLDGHDVVVTGVTAGPSPDGGPGDAWAFTWQRDHDIGLTLVHGPSSPDRLSIPGLPTTTWSTQPLSTAEEVTAALVPDVTGDMLPDLVVGRSCVGPICPWGGDVWVIPGDPAPGASQRVLDLVGATAPGFRLVATDQSLIGFGATVASAGDVNGDGHGDLLIGAPQDGELTGTVVLLYGPLPRGSFRVDQIGSELPGAVIERRGRLGNLGAAMTTLGDIDGDGHDEVALAAPSALDTGARASGAVYVFRGRGD